MPTIKNQNTTSLLTASLMSTLSNFTPNKLTIILSSIYMLLCFIKTESHNMQSFVFGFFFPTLCLQDPPKSQHVGVAWFIIILYYSICRNMLYSFYCLQHLSYFWFGSIMNKTFRNISCVSLLYICVHFCWVYFQEQSFWLIGYVYIQLQQFLPCPFQFSLIFQCLLL